jgi:hypothetical protein
MFFPILVIFHISSKYLNTELFSLLLFTNYNYRARYLTPWSSCPASVYIYLMSSITLSYFLFSISKSLCSSSPLHFLFHFSLPLFISFVTLFHCPFPFLFIYYLIRHWPILGQLSLILFEICLFQFSSVFLQTSFLAPSSSSLHIAGRDSLLRPSCIQGIPLHQCSKYKDTTLHKNIEFRTLWFNVCCNITSKFRAIAS